MKYLIIPRIH